jgi:methyl-accepting chemotaxis protein
MGQSALTITRSVAQIIDGDKLQELKTPADMETDYYKQLRDEFIKIRKETGLKFLYTMARKEDGSVVYIMDGSDYGSEDESFIGDVETDVSYKMLQSLDGKEDYEYYDGDWGALISGYVPLINSKGECIGMLGADFDAEVMKKNLSETSRMMILVTAIVIVIGILVSLGFTYLIVRFIKLLNSKVQLIQGGDLTVNIETDRSDEVGSLAASFRKMIEKMSDMIHNIRDHSEKVSLDVDSLNGSIDVSNRATEEITKVVAEIASGAVQQVESVEAVENSMQHVFTEIESITKNIDSVGADSDHAVSDMQEASEKLSSSVQQINLVNDTVEVTATMMKQLEEKFKEVLSFSDSVTEIATRTNLLALNASIEAASAGEHGRGFAVVAREINSLAKQSRDASKRINDLIVAVQEEIRNSSNAIGNGVTQARNGVSVMSEVEQHLDKLSDTNRKMNSRLKEISQAILRIEDDSRNVLDKTTLLADIARDLSAGTQQTAAETEEQYAIMEGIKNDLAKVKDQMQSLSSTVNQFKIQ